MNNTQKVNPVDEKIDGIINTIDLTVCGCEENERCSICNKKRETIRILQALKSGERERFLKYFVADSYPERCVNKELDNLILDKQKGDV